MAKLDGVTLAFGGFISGFGVWYSFITVWGPWIKVGTGSHSP
jgi:hypothetical protein